MQPIPSISIEHLSKRYPSTNKVALDDLSLTVYPGEVYGFLGPNGAGKSTTIRLLMNFIQPTSGGATILGKHIVSDSVALKKSIGYLSSDSLTYDKMTGRQFLDYMSELLPPVSQVYVQDLTKRLHADLGPKLGTLSRGNRQKINIIQAFMHQPQILILDEPTSGLDPLMQEVFYELIAESKQRGASIFTSSHILGEVQKICDRVGIIREGKLVDERSIKDMTHEAAQTFDITFASLTPIAKLKQIAGVHIVSHKDTTVVLQLHGKLAPLFAELAKQNVLTISTRSLDLEEVFMHFYAETGAKK